ncbi:MAG: hypothetical protein LRY51_01950 [Geovibrio sp.]|nr:hypothetical protein [Geovibrio sp.]
MEKLRVQPFNRPASFCSIILSSFRRISLRTSATGASGAQSASADVLYAPGLRPDFLRAWAMGI